MTILFQAKFLIFIVFFCLQFSLVNSATYRHLSCSGKNYLNEFKVVSKEELLNKLKTIVIKNSHKGDVQHISFDFINMRHHFTGWGNKQISSANLTWVNKPIKYVVQNLNKCVISDGAFLIQSENPNADGFATIFFNQDIGYFVQRAHINDSEYVISEYYPDTTPLNIVDFKTGNLFDYFSKKSKKQTANPQVKVPAQKQQVVRNESTDPFDKYEKRIAMIKMRCTSDNIVWATDGKDIYYSSGVGDLKKEVVGNGSVKNIIKKEGKNIFIVKSNRLYEDGDSFHKEQYVNFDEKKYIYHARMSGKWDTTKEYNCYRD